MDSHYILCFPKPIIHADISAGEPTSLPHATAKKKDMPTSYTPALSFVFALCLISPVNSGRSHVPNFSLEIAVETPMFSLAWSQLPIGAPAEVVTSILSRELLLTTTLQLLRPFSRPNSVILCSSAGNCDVHHGSNKVSVAFFFKNRVLDSSAPNSFVDCS
jgi:hypothetical protein